jgi:integrase
VGSIYPRKNKLWIRFKGADGAWTQSKTPFHLGEDDGARKLLKRVESKIAAGAEVQGSDAGPLTLAIYARKWNEERSKLGLADWKNDEARLLNHVLPRLGSMPIDEIRPRHLADVFRRLRGIGKLAPKTIRNIYSAVMALFRDAQLADLIETSPCILTKYQLGENVDKDLAWRPTAIYTRAELEMLIADARIPWDRQVLYGLEGIAGLRHGEAAGLRWSDYDSTLKPLGRLSVWNSYATGRTKTKRARYMPVHPTLGAMLAEWRLKGWVEMIGRVPKPEDLIVPMPEGPRVELGKMRSKNDSYKRLCTDLVELGLRHRRGQDLRRTMISLTRTDGARKDLLELCTHTPRNSARTPRASRAPSTSTRSSRGNRFAGRWRSSGSTARSAGRSSPSDGRSTRTSRAARTTARGSTRVRWPQKPQ